MTGWQEAAQKRQDTNSGSKKRNKLLYLKFMSGGMGPILLLLPSGEPQPPLLRTVRFHTLRSCRGQESDMKLDLPACTTTTAACCLVPSLPGDSGSHRSHTRPESSEQAQFYRVHWLQGTKAKSRDLARLAAIEQLQQATSFPPWITARLPADRC